MTKDLKSAGASDRRRWLMRLVAATSVPLLLLGGLEVGLRVGGYGYPTRYWLPSTIDEREFLIPNYRFSYRFFPPSLARKPVLQRMAAEKPSSTYRIFLFGESAAFGDPDPSFGVGRYLEVLLEERSPGTDVEVVCVAMTAINSHAVLPIARECADHDGDLWIIYMGNNEMVGPYGAGTVFGAKAPALSLVRGVLALKTTRVGQLLDRVVAGMRRPDALPQAWTGIDMFARNPVRHDDPARLRAYDNFRANVEDVLRAGIEAEVPILLCTVASNLQDCSPFLSLHRPALGAAQLAEWEKWYAQGVALQEAGDFQGALGAYSNAAALDGEFAELRFRVGACHVGLGNRDEALQAYILARDQDALAVRADSRINHILRAAGTNHADERVRLVDAARELAGHSTNGVPGRELFYEHVHFTLEGNYQLARLLGENLVTLWSPGMTAQSRGAWAAKDVCDRRLAVTLFDQHRLWTEAARRISVPPFTSQSGHAEDVRYVEARQQEVLARVTPESSEEGRALYEEALARAPDDHLLRGNFAQFLEANGSRPQSIVEGQRVCEMLPDLAWPHYYVGALMVREGRVAEAAEYFGTALEIQDDFVPARKALQQLHHRYPHVLQD